MLLIGEFKRRLNNGEISELLLVFGLGILIPFTIFFAILVYLAFEYPTVFDKLSTGLGFGGIFLAFVSFILYIMDKFFARIENKKREEKLQERRLNRMLKIVEKIE